VARSPIADPTPNERSASRILLVEDERVVALAEQRTLERYGYQVATVHAGEDAVVLVREDAAIDLVLMDIDLGDGMDGTEAATRLLAVREVPVVFLTGHAEREMVERVKGITRYGYVLKTAGEFVLIQAIEMAFELFASRQEAVAAAERYRSVSNLTGEIIVQHDAEGRWTFLNDRACEFWGASREELLGRDLREFLHPDDHPDLSLVMHDLTTMERSIRGRTNRQKTPTGWRTVDWNSEVIRDSFGRATGYQATGRDVTDRIDLERSLTYHRDLLQKMMYTTPTSILVLAADGTITHVNRRAGEVLGVDPAEVEGLHRDCLPWRLETADGEPLPPDRGPFSAVRRTGKAVFDIACTLRRPDGERRRLEISSAPLLTPDGEFDGTVAVLEDVTERRESEERVRKLLEEKELLIREIHHRVKNDLNLVQSLASLQMRQSSNEETKAALDEMINRLAVMSRVYDALRTGGEMQRVALDELLATLVDGLRRTTLPAGVALDLDASPLLVRQTVAVAIGIMVNELVTNSVRHGLADAAEGTISVLATANGGMIEVIVADSGSGFPASFVQEPSYGYGLTIVDALARQHDGSFELDNEKGARARVVLPLDG